MLPCGFFLGLRSKIGGERILLLGVSLFHLSFLILEVDFRKLDAPALNKVFNGKIRDAWLGGLWLWLGIAFVRKRVQTWQEFLQWIKSPSGIVLVLSGVFWIASGLIDKSLLGRKELYREEFMEVNATLLMLISAIIFCLRKTSAKSVN